MRRIISRVSGLSVVFIAISLLAMSDSYAQSEKTFRAYLGVFMGYRLGELSLTFDGSRVGGVRLSLLKRPLFDDNVFSRKEREALRTCAAILPESPFGSSTFKTFYQEQYKVNRFWSWSSADPGSARYPTDTFPRGARKFAIAGGFGGYVYDPRVLPRLPFNVEGYFYANFRKGKRSCKLNGVPFRTGVPLN